MTTPLVITVMGTDRPGPGEALSKALAATAATGWTAVSRVWAGASPLASVPEAEAGTLKEVLGALGTEALRITVEHKRPGGLSDRKCVATPR